MNLKKIMETFEKGHPELVTPFLKGCGKAALDVVELVPTQNAGGAETIVIGMADACCVDEKTILVDKRTEVKEAAFKKYLTAAAENCGKRFSNRLLKHPSGYVCKFPPKEGLCLLKVTKMEACVRGKVAFAGSVSLNVYRTDVDDDNNEVPG